jgi:hypothetical protein
MNIYVCASRSGAGPLMESNNILALVILKSLLLTVVIMVQEPQRWMFGPIEENPHLGKGCTSAVVGPIYLTRFGSGILVLFTSLFIIVIINLVR